LDTAWNITEFTRWYLAVFFSGVAVFYTARIVLLTRGGSGARVFPGERYTSTWWNHLTFRVFRALIWLVCLTRLPFPAVDDHIGMIAALENFYVILLGNLLLTAGFTLTIVAHFSLGEKWNSGIDPQGPPTLKTNGLYRFSRNPMFVGVALGQLGFFLALPSLFSLICLFIGLLALRRQVISEEMHLAATFSRQYPKYVALVRRWV
jgi:protein-S-isoprenylcysteine O-methyltransferase Ste14